MNVNLKRLDTSLPLPKFESKGACGFDFLAREERTVAPKQIELIPANTIIEVPEGHMLMIAPRSSTPRKTGLCFPHSIGIIDQDFCGEEDEIQIQVMNFTDKPVTIKKGDRIAQGLFVKIEKAEWIEVTEITAKTRGMFGSTGGHSND